MGTTLRVKFEESYYQLIGFIKSANKNCAMYLSKIIPQGDTDVTEFNNSIQRLSDHWKVHQVTCIENTSKMFLGRNGMPSFRYYSHDGIHLSRSGIKRLVDALNRNLHIVTDINLCVFKGSNFRDERSSRPGTNSSRNYNGRSGQGNRGWGFNGHWMNNNCGSYGCALPGHIYADCWYSQYEIGTIAGSRLNTSSLHMNQFSIFESLCSNCDNFECTCSSQARDQYRFISSKLNRLENSLPSI